MVTILKISYKNIRTEESTLSSSSSSSLLFYYCFYSNLSWWWRWTNNNENVLLDRYTEQQYSFWTTYDNKVNLITKRKDIFNDIFTNQTLRLRVRRKKQNEAKQVERLCCVVCMHLDSGEWSFEWKLYLSSGSTAFCVWFLFLYLFHFAGFWLLISFEYLFGEQVQLVFFI